MSELAEGLGAEPVKGVTLWVREFDLARLTRETADAAKARLPAMVGLVIAISLQFMSPEYKAEVLAMEP